MRKYRHWDYLADDAMLVQLHAQQLSDYAIAERMALPYGTVRDHRRRLGLPTYRPVRSMSPEAEGTPFATKVDPLAAAAKTLHGFDRETMTLRGKPVKLNEVMRLTNARLKAEGLPQILANPTWEAP